jgi:hypothetical protein
MATTSVAGVAILALVVCAFVAFNAKTRAVPEERYRDGQPRFYLGVASPQPHF